MAENLSEFYITWPCRIRLIRQQIWLARATTTLPFRSNCVGLSEALCRYYCLLHQLSRLFGQLPNFLHGRQLFLCVGPPGSASRLHGLRLAQRQLSQLLCCLHKFVFASLSVFPNYHCPSATRFPQSISLLRTSHLRKSISWISVCVFSNWPQASIYTFPVERSTIEIKSLINN